MYERILHWFAENWIAAALPFVGALVAHLKNFEAQTVEKSYRWHAYGYLSRIVYALFSVLIVGNILDYYQAPKQLGYVAMAVCSVYPDAVITWLLDYMKSFADKWKVKQ